MNDVIFYGDGTQNNKPLDNNGVKRNTRILDLIDDDTKKIWKEQEESGRKPRIENDVNSSNVKEIAKQPLKDFVKIITPEQSGNVFLQQKQASYNQAKEKILNGEVLTSKDEDLPFSIRDLQQYFRQDGIATVISMPIGKNGCWKLRKM